MPRGDAVQSRPTLEQEASKFIGFTTTDGEVADGSQTAEEARVLAANEAKVDEAAAEAGGTEAAAAEGAGDDAQDDAAKAAKAAADKRPKKTAEERIKDITRLRRTAERERDDERAARAADAAQWERRLAALERGDKGLTSGDNAAKTDGSVAPDPKDFTYGELDAGYIRALARFETRQEIAADRANQDRQRTTAAASAEMQEVRAKAKAFDEAGSAKYDDFIEVVVESAKAGEWPMSDVLGKLVLSSSQGPDIAYHLASNPKEAREIFGKSPLEQAAYFGRLEAKFSADPAAKTKTSAGTAAAGGSQQAKVSGAPAPVTHARGAGGQTQVSPDTGDFAAFEALAMKRR